MLEGLFDIDNVLARLEKKGDILAKLDDVFDWDDFRPILSRIRKCDARRTARVRIICNLPANEPQSRPEAKYCASHNTNGYCSSWLSSNPL